MFPGFEWCGLDKNDRAEEDFLRIVFPDQMDEDRANEGSQAQKKERVKKIHGSVMGEAFRLIPFESNILRLACYVLKSKTRTNEMSLRRLRRVAAEVQSCSVAFRTITFSKTLPFFILLK
jgi:hypothetical protein